MNQDTIQLVLIFTIVVLAVFAAVAVIFVGHKMADRVADPPTIPEATEKVLQAEIIMSQDLDAIAHIERFIRWQCSTVGHAIAHVQLRNDPDRTVTDIPEQAFVRAMDIRRRCIGNRTTITGQDQLQIIEATFRWCAEHIGIMEPQH